MRLRLTTVLPLLAACGDAELPPTGPEVPAPAPPAGLEVVASAPADGAVGVARAAFVTLSFSAPVDPGTVNAGTVGLWRGPESVPFSLAVNRTTAWLTPRSLLDLGTTYVVTASRGIRDTAGTPMSRDFRLVFTTKVNVVP
jgi:hypothetical protein